MFCLGLGYRLNLYLNALEAIEKTAKKLKKKEDLNIRKFLYAPRKWNICIDFRVFRWD
jgi:tRNA G37 N-methylase Trm5